MGQEDDRFDPIDRVRPAPNFSWLPKYLRVDECENVQRHQRGWDTCRKKFLSWTFKTGGIGVAADEHASLFKFLAPPRLSEKLRRPKACHGAVADRVRTRDEQLNYVVSAVAWRPSSTQLEAWIWKRRQF